MLWVTHTIFLCTHYHWLAETNLNKTKIKWKKCCCFLKKIVNDANWTSFINKIWGFNRKHVCTTVSKKGMNFKRVVNARYRTGGRDKKVSPTDTEETSYHRKLLLQMSDPPNRGFASLFSPWSSTSYEHLQRYPQTKGNHMYTYPYRQATYINITSCWVLGPHQSGL